MYKVNKQKCIGCGACVQTCSGATKMGTDNKAEIIDQQKLEQCGGENVCPFGAIEKVGKERKEETKQKTGTEFIPSQGRGMGGIGRGRRLGADKGKGLGLRSQNSRGRGRGGGGRKG